MIVRFLKRRYCFIADNMEKKILIADDEVVFRKLISDFLKKDGYFVIEADNGKEALYLYQNNSDVDLVILDVMMPELDGYEVCKNIRNIDKKVPILILTAKDREEDQINAFESGADDYISKPFSFPILMLRIKALIKRSAVGDDILIYNNIKIDIPQHQVFVNDTIVDLTPKEFELLVYLINNRKIVISREKILSQIWGYDYFGDNRTVDTHIKNLRIKLNDDGSLIKTIRGYGYKIE